MFVISAEKIESWNGLKFRPVFGQIIAELAKQRPDVVLVVADSGRACRLDGFDGCPQQFVDVGIAEQNMIGVAAGLARCGKKPFVFAFCPFASERCFEQIRIDAAYSQLNIVIVGSEGGVGMGTQGVTHYGWEDMAVMRALPGMTVLCPADHRELLKCMEAAMEVHGAVYLRMDGGTPQPVYAADYSFQIGKGILHQEGKSVNILACGCSVKKALEAAQKLRLCGIDAGVADMHTLKPFDTELTARLAHTAPLMVTIEEHSIVGGLGSTVAEVLAEIGSGCRLVRMGLPDEYPHTVSPYKIMMQDYGITVENLITVIRKNLA